MILILIPARGGSKGIPRKNIKPLKGTPLLEWTAKAIHQAALPGAIPLLSTDDPEIAELGRSLGLEVPFLRPEHLAQDSTTIVPVALHAMDWLKTHQGIEITQVMSLQPTSPFRPPQALHEAISKMAGTDAIIGVKPIHRTLANLFLADDQLNLRPVDAREEKNSQRQTIQPLYTPNGAMYLIRAEALRRENTFFPRATRGMLMNQIASVDIDDPVDWKMAEAIAAAGLTWR